MIGVCKVGIGREEYYLATTASARDHPHGLIEADGRWFGAGAAQFGLTGTARPDDVRYLLAGVVPETGEWLLAPHDRRRVAAYDCTFSAPKSVSILHALSRPEVTSEIRLAHEAAVAAALGYLETQAIAVRVPSLDGPKVVREGGMVAVGFLHRASRAPDPHLHSHILVANLVTAPDGEATARPLDARGLFLEHKTAGALYETHLRFELTSRLGVAWRELKGCWADIEGIDPAAIGWFSRRSNDIRAAVESSGLKGPHAARLMAEVTRPPKQLDIAYEIWQETWREEGWALGISVSRLESVLDRVDRPQPQPEGDRSSPWQDAALRLVAENVIDGTFCRRDLVRARCAVAPTGRDAAGVLDDVDRLLAAERVVVRGGRPASLAGGAGAAAIPAGRVESRYTSREVAEAEREVLSLADAQRAALTVASYGPSERAGTLHGLSVAAAQWMAEGKSIVAIAPSRSAATSFEAMTGIETVSRPARGSRGATALRQQAPFPRGSVVVVAEAQCFGPVSLGAILASCGEQQASLVLLGSSWGIERSPVLSGVASLAEAHLPGSPERVLAPAATIDPTGAPNPTGAPGPTARHRSFGSVDVVAVPSLGAALEEVARQAGDPSDRVLVVASDHAVLSALRDIPNFDGSRAVHTRDVKSVATDPDHPANRIIVIGGSSVLRQRELPGISRSHVVIIPGLGSPSEAPRLTLGKMLEAAMPAYLVNELGRAPAGRTERSAWREAAVVIEEFRGRWHVTDAKRALGPSGPDQDAGRLADKAEAEREVRCIGGLEVRQREPGLGLGR